MSVFKDEKTNKCYAILISSIALCIVKNRVAYWREIDYNCN